MNLMIVTMRRMMKKRTKVVLSIKFSNVLKITSKYST